MEPLPFINCVHPSATDITRFRLGAHKLPIEKGRWTRIPREERKCPTCGVLGDERHVIYDCVRINRTGLELCNDISRIWSQRDIFGLFREIKREEYV